MIYLTMMIFVKEGKEQIFDEFEAQAIPILKDYQGELIYRIRTKKEDYLVNSEETPYEIHFISFPSEEDFHRFAKDERRKEFIHLKEESIKYSYLVKGVKL
ncbi:DUF1330 domain-containing protein [Reichenbachiella ulvae]|uniref:DUF1330 domain-containing protein n=1 Tax=Reichenbachiella ulvae TaxID=2980104 RepID=A0ABT3CPM9_9BACT|nr:DUF1330 domain-containing protein [Reichenbachiella ulvae]MCV9385531.1 DUF1330 domain-containing protein [Reichenbachiella ulvae]